MLAGGVLLSLAANLSQAQPTAWGRIVAAVAPAAFLVTVSMIERRAARHPPAECQDQHGQPIIRDALRARLGISNQAAFRAAAAVSAAESRPPTASHTA